MKKWLYTVSFKAFWVADIPVEQKGKLAAKKLEKLKRYFADDETLADIIEEFAAVSGDGEPPEKTEFTAEEDFNARMHDLYEWADDKRVWVATTM